MKNWKILTITAATFVLASLLLTTVSAACGPLGGGLFGGYSFNTHYGDPSQTGTTPTEPATPYRGYQAVYPFQFGGGCMGLFGWGGYGGYAAPTYTGVQLNITTTETIADNYVAAINNHDLEVAHVEEYQANFYVQVNEKSTDNGAFELLINKYTGSIYPEMGPNMMWNTKYGMMRSGILGGVYGIPTTSMTVTPEQATANAQAFLNSYLPGTTTGDVATFYGYYTIEVLNGTTPYGMLSVNGYTGQVWYHTWHGSFIQELEEA